MTGRTGLKHLEFPEGLTRLGSDEPVSMERGVNLETMNVFYGCKNLTALRLQASLAFISEFTFGRHASMLPASLEITVPPGSYAEACCRENGIRYVVAGEENRQTAE